MHHIQTAYTNRWVTSIVVGVGVVAVLDRRMHAAITDARRNGYRAGRRTRRADIHALPRKDETAAR